MGYELDCDTCDYTRVVEDEGETYPLAKDHETEHPTHFVFITSKR